MPQVNIDQHWGLWARATFVKHFTDTLSGHKVFAEEQPKDTKDLQQWFEIRADGPFVRRHSKRLFTLMFEVNILVSHIQAQKDNRYSMHSLAGEVAAGFVQCMAIKKYGPTSDPANDGSVFAHARIDPRQRSEDVETSFFGLVDPATSLYQATVEGHYSVQVEVSNG